MNWGDISEWAVRILGGLAALFIGVPLVVALLSAIGNVLATIVAWAVGLTYIALWWVGRKVWPAASTMQPKAGDQASISGSKAHQDKTRQRDKAL